MLKGWKLLWFVDTIGNECGLKVGCLVKSVLLVTELWSLSPRTSLTAAVCVDPRGQMMTDSLMDHISSSLVWNRVDWSWQRCFFCWFFMSACSWASIRFCLPFMSWLFRTSGWPVMCSDIKAVLGKHADAFENHSVAEFPKEPLFIWSENSPSLCSPSVSLSRRFLFLPGIVWGHPTIKNLRPFWLSWGGVYAVFWIHRNLQKLARCMFCFVGCPVLYAQPEW